MPEKLQKLFGKAIRRRREAVEVTQETLAHQAGLSRNYVGMLERGERVPTIITLHRLAKALDTTMASLILELEKALGEEIPSQKPRKGKGG